MTRFQNSSSGKQFGLSVLGIKQMEQYFLNKNTFMSGRGKGLLLWREPNIFDYIRPFYPKVNKLAWNPLDSKQLLLVVWLNYYQTVFRVLLDHFWSLFTQQLWSKPSQIFMIYFYLHWKIARYLITFHKFRRLQFDARPSYHVKYWIIFLLKQCF